MSKSRVVVVIKVALLVAGLKMLVGTERPLANSAQHEGQVWFKGIGGFLLVLAAIPFRLPRESQKPVSDAEEL
jgi:hypothetical protein